MYWAELSRDDLLNLVYLFFLWGVCVATPTSQGYRNRIEPIGDVGKSAQSCDHGRGIPTTHLS